MQNTGDAHSDYRVSRITRGGRIDPRGLLIEYQHPSLDVLPLLEQLLLLLELRLVASDYQVKLIDSAVFLFNGVLLFLEVGL